MKSKRFTELDGLRGIAALWVVVFHLTFGLSHFWLKDQPELAGEITPFNFNSQGLLAVDLFFVISGFVIRMTVERSRTAFDFATSRFARLFPAFWAAVVVSTTVGILLPSPRLPVSLSQGIANLTMLHDYIGVPAVDNSYWSLSVELGFYAMMAVVLLTGQRDRIDRLGAAWLFAAFACVQLLPSLGLVLPWRVTIALALPYAGLFYAGSLFYRVRVDGLNAWRVAAIALCLASRVAFAPPLTAVIECGIFLTFALGVGDKLAILRARPLLFLGGISYSFYVVHQPLGFRLQMGLHTLGASPWLNLALTLGLLLAAATAMTHLVERPGTRLLRTLLAARRTLVPQTLA